MLSSSKYYVYSMMCTFSAADSSSKAESELINFFTAMGHFFSGDPKTGHFDEPDRTPTKRIPNITVTPSGVRADKIDSKPVVTGETPTSVTMQNQGKGWRGEPTEFKKLGSLGGFVKNNPVDPSSGEHYELSAEAKTEADKTSDFTNEPLNAATAAGEAAKVLRKELPESVAKQGRLKR